jgi:TolA-binding protein
MGDPIVSTTTLSEEQLRELNKKLSHMRHEVNNQLSLMVAALELVRFRPEMRDRMMDTLAQQPAKIQEEIARFSADFEQALGIIRS